MGTPRAQRSTVGSNHGVDAALAGVDLFMMMHPAAVKTLKETVNRLTSNGKADPAKYYDWVAAKP